MRHLRHFILVLAMANIVFSLAATQWVALVISVGVFIYLAPPHTPPRHPKPRISELESWERALRVEFYADDITAQEFEAEYWRYLLIYDQGKRRRPTTHTEHPVLGCGCQACSEINKPEPFERPIVGRRLG